MKLFQSIEKNLKTAKYLGKMITLANIRKNLINAIKLSGLTQTELAERVGIRQATIGQYLSGRAMPALDTFAKLCSVLDLDANDILCISNSAI